MHIIETKKWSTHLSTQNYSIQFKFLSNKKPTKKWNTRPSTQNYSILFKFLSNNKPTKRNEIPVQALKIILLKAQNFNPKSQ